VDLGLSGKVAIVTGGSEGIGKATGLALAREGARVALVARRHDVLEAAAAEIGEDVLAIPGDVTRPHDLERVVAVTRKKLGEPTILVNNAGGSAAHPFDEIDDDAWHADFELKLHAAVRLTRLVLPSMRAAGDGRIVNVTAILGRTPTASSLPTSATRAAGQALTKALAHDLAPKGIRVNTVCIGLIKSAQIARMAQGAHPGTNLDEAYDRLATSIPMRRVGEASEAAAVIAFLLSDAASYVTGVAINIDGGTSGAV
jgi:NAD(P)-dependent dehydrogenase (short-subunit alcohol dehydrogenase family)